MDIEWGDFLLIEYQRSHGLSYCLATSAVLALFRQINQDITTDETSIRPNYTWLPRKRVTAMLELVSEQG